MDGRLRPRQAGPGGAGVEPDYSVQCGCMGRILGLLACRVAEASILLVFSRRVCPAQLVNRAGALLRRHCMDVRSPAGMSGPSSHPACCLSYRRNIFPSSFQIPGSATTRHRDSNDDSYHRETFQPTPPIVALSHDTSVAIYFLITNTANCLPLAFPPLPLPPSFFPRQWPRGCPAPQPHGFARPP